MPTRAAVKRELDLLKESPANANSKRKRAPPKNKTSGEPVFGGWEYLPHGLGKAHDTLQSVAVKSEISDGTIPPPKRQRNAKATTNGQSTPVVRVKSEPEDNAGEGIEADGQGTLDVKVKSEPEEKATEGIEADVQGNISKSETRSGVKTGPKQTKASAQGSSNTDENLDLVKDKSTLSETSSLIGRQANIAPKDELRKIKTPRARKKQVIALDLSESVVNKVEEQPKESKKDQKIKQPKMHKFYGLTPGFSPFPDLIKPTPEDCEEVARILSELHGEVIPPKKIPPPSMEVAGCGEVPDILDALLRTVLSGATSMSNSDKALKGLHSTFGLRISGIGKGSINWEAVRNAEVTTVVGAIRSGGLMERKAKHIKIILDTIYQQNCARRHSILADRMTGESTVTRGAKHETGGQDNINISDSSDNLLSLDHLFELTSDEVMEELMLFPGVGPKTASCVILFNMQRPSFAVDTHVWRHCKYLGWVPQNATDKKTFSHCEVRVPDHLKYKLHQLFIRHGKTCHRCRSNTQYGTPAWNKTVCPIEHLVHRYEEAKQPGFIPKEEPNAKTKTKTKTKSKTKTKAKAKKHNSSDEELDAESDEDDVSMDDVDDEDNDE